MRCNLMIIFFRNYFSNLPLAKLWALFVSGTNLQALKQELELDVHRIGIDELCKRFNSDLDRGLTKAAALEGNRKYGLNALTPPPTTPGTAPGLDFSSLLMQMSKFYRLSKF